MLIKQVIEKGSLCVYEGRGMSRFLHEPMNESNHRYGVVAVAYSVMLITYVHIIVVYL